MNSIYSFIQNAINNALMQTHTAFCATVISVDTEKRVAKVQPLNMVKAVGGKPQKQAVIPTVPILKHVGSVYKGDTVFCVCAERDITETRKGRFALPVKGRHQLSDAVIVGKFEV